MKSTKTFLFAAAAIGFILSSSTSAYYQVIDLGALSGYPYSWAYSINNSGQIVGAAYDSSGYGHACLFDPTGGGANIDLGTLGGPWSVGGNINERGQIVGWAYDSSGYFRACLFDPTGGGNNTDLGTLDCGYWKGNSGACTINNSGQIVGFSDGYTTGGSGYVHACLFDPTGGGNNTDLGTLGGGGSWANSINDSGQIVGASGHACLFDSTGGGANIDLGTIAGYNYSIARSINNNGQIVGEVYKEQSINSVYPRACLFDPTGSGANIDLGTIAGFDYSSALSINDSGQIVGWAENSSGGVRACLFDPTGGGNNIDLNTLIDPSSSLSLVYACSINNNGWIVGFGPNPEGSMHAFLLTPEPASALLMILGIFALRKRRR